MDDMELTAEERAEVVAVLDAAIAYVQHGWTQGANARDQDGNIVWWHDEDAMSWCLYGALCIGARDVGLTGRGGDALNTAARAVKAITGETEFNTWNDEPQRTKAEVVAVLEEAKRSA